MDEPRIANLTAAESCAHCSDEGLMIVSWRKACKRRLREEYGPCPHCERGYRREFPAKGRCPWGPKGYWQGRPAELAEPMEDGGLLPREENLARTRLLLALLAGMDADPLVAITVADQGARMDAVQAELRRITPRTSDPFLEAFSGSGG